LAHPATCGACSRLARPEAACRIQNAVDATDKTIKDIRATIFGLHSRGDDKPPSLRSQIVTVVDEMTPLLGFTPTLRLDADLHDQVTRAPAGNVLAALREALSNAARDAPGRVGRASRRGRNRA